MDEIAASLGISKRTLYEVFPDKETLLEECIPVSYTHLDVYKRQPVYVELEVVDMGKAEDGFAADYEGVYQIMKINKMALK